MWTVTVGKASRNGLPLMQLTYTDGVRTVMDSYDAGPLLSDAYLADQAKARIDQLEQQDAKAAKITLGPVAPAALPPLPVVQYQQDFLLWSRMRKLIELEIMSARDPAFAALDKTVKSNFDPSFIASLPMGSFS